MLAARWLNTAKQFGLKRPFLLLLRIYAVWGQRAASPRSNFNHPFMAFLDAAAVGVVYFPAHLWIC